MKKYFVLRLIFRLLSVRLKVAFAK